MSEVISKTLESGSNIIKSGVHGITQFIRENPLLSGAALGGSVLAGITAVQVVKSRKKKAKAKKSAKKRKARKTKRKGKKAKRKYKYARTAGKGRDRSTKRIRMTKNGQPYVILKSGKARFIKKSSARRSRKLKGGRY